jgi:hypothetical protein
VSDGPCNGGPPAGNYWPQYALSPVRHLVTEARAGHRAALSWVLSGPRWETK